MNFAQGPVDLEEAERLRRENASLSKRVADIDRQANRVEFEYQKLAKSKLGRLTLWYWRHKDAIKAWKGGKAKSSAAMAAKASEAGRPPPKGDEGFFARMSEKIRDMPQSNGSRYFKKLDAKIGIVCDRFYHDSVKDAADFVYLSPDADETALAELDCLLLVSSWSGLKDDEWSGLAVAGSPQRAQAERIIEACRRRHVPAVFYSKEDPPNYESFLGLAQKCDFIFTSAAECVPDYKRDCGHDRVKVMNFCVNPAVHNPIGIRHRDKERNVIFSGSWMKKYPHRCRDLATIFDGVLAAGRELNIVDRNYALRDNSVFAFPERYRRFQSPAVDHGDLQRIHRLYDWAVNINTVKSSTTMFANRAYELQATGNLLLSNYSLGVSNLLPTVFLVRDSADVPRIMNSFTPEEVYERQLAGVRRVMTGETCFDRIAEMLNAVGIECAPQDRKVLVVAKTLTGSVKAMFDRQSYRNKVLKAEDKVTKRDYEQSDIVAFFDEAIDYGVFYLEDMANAFKYTDCDYVTKDAYLEAGRLHAGVEHDYVDRMRSKARTLFWRESFGWEQLKALGAGPLPRGYAVDHLNCEERRQEEEPNGSPELSVVIPCRDNGWFLYGRAFASLRRSPYFDKMEIVIVDEGSTDDFTPKMAMHLASMYANVRTLDVAKGGGGAPSRLRERGVAMARGKFVVFLDPENEAVCEGEANLPVVSQRCYPAAARLCPEGTRVELVSCESPLPVPPHGEFVSERCELSEFVMVSVSGTVKCDGLPEAMKSALLMAVEFTDAAGRVLKSGTMSESPRYGEYAYLSAGGGQPCAFRRIISVPEGAVALVVKFTRWNAAEEMSVLDFKIVASRM